MNKGITRGHRLFKKSLLVWVVQISFQFHRFWATYEIDNVAKFAVPSGMFISFISVKEEICSTFHQRIMSAYHCINIEFNLILLLVENAVFMSTTMKTKFFLITPSFATIYVKVRNGYNSLWFVKCSYFQESQHIKL